MKRFRNILVIYGDRPGSDDALGQAAALAAANGADLTVATLLDERAGTRAMREETEKRTQRIVSGIADDGIASVSCRFLSGNAPVEIVRQVLLDGHDLVFVSAESGGGFSDAVFGRTVTQLMRKCPCPVWAVRHGETVPHRQVLAAIDLDEEGGADLSARVLDIAAALAAADGAELHVVHGWDVDGAERTTAYSEAPPAVYADILARHEEARRARIRALLHSAGVSAAGVKIHLPRTEARKAILDTAAQAVADVIVMGMAGAPRRAFGFGGTLGGNSAEGILADVGCAVLTVKPGDFVSPIAPIDHDSGMVRETVRA